MSDDEDQQQYVVLEQSVTCVHVLLLFPAARQPSNYAFTEYLTNIRHVIECEDPGCPRKKTQALENACRDQVEKIHIRTIRDLQAIHTNDSLAALELWKMFAQRLGVSEEGIRQKLLDSNGCCYPICPNRDDKNAKMRKCSACKKVMYCTPQCQKA